MSKIFLIVAILLIHTTLGLPQFTLAECFEVTTNVPAPHLISTDGDTFVRVDVQKPNDFNFEAAQTTPTEYTSFGFANQELRDKETEAVLLNNFKQTYEKGKVEVNTFVQGSGVLITLWRKGRRRQSDCEKYECILISTTGFENRRDRMALV